MTGYKIACVGLLLSFMASAFEIGSPLLSLSITFLVQKLHWNTDLCSFPVTDLPRKDGANNLLQLGQCSSLFLSQ